MKEAQVPTISDECYSGEGTCQIPDTCACPCGHLYYRPCRWPYKYTVVEAEVIEE